MKKILTLLLTLLCTSWVMAAEEVEKEPITVTTAEQFIEVIQNDNDANIQLGADIQLGKLNARICETFTGSINGSFQAIDPDDGELKDCSHVIYGDPDIQVEWTNHELFGTVEGAVFRDVAFANIFVNVSNHSFTGLIASNAVDSKFFNVTFEKVKVSCNNDDAGVIAGQAERCLFGVVSTTHCDVYTAGKEAGGLVGKSTNCNFEMCINNPTTCVFADGREVDGGAYAGGFSGWSVADNFKTCINAAMVGGAASRVGGYTGMSKYSDFLSCENSGYVVHSRHDLFVESVKKAQAKIDTWIDTELSATVSGLVGMGITIGGFVISPYLISSVATNICKTSFYIRTGNGLWNWYNKITYSLSASQFTDARIEFLIRYGIKYKSTFYTTNYVIEESGLMKGASVAGYANVILKPMAIILAIEVAATVGWEIYEGDDEVGGFSAQAQGSVFEQCSNLGNVRCKDDNCGGIVGLGQGVTIINCFNEGYAQWNEDDTTGSILGKAEVNEEDGNKKCLVTNCLSTWAFHIVGDYKLEDGLDPASGNNYRMEGGKGDPVFCEMPINQEQLESGLVAMWLNQGYENRTAGIKPWRQTFWITDKDKDRRPYLDDTHDEVNAENLNYGAGLWKITDGDMLMSYAKHVNEVDQFACAILVADIDLSGKTWIPIGHDGFNTNFRGIFDGQGHTISGLKCESDKAVGLFGTVHSGAEIRNVVIADDCEFTSTGSSGVGAIVGEVPIGWHWGNVVIENCANYGTVTAKNEVNAGGILGLVRNNTNDNVRVMVNNCYNMGIVTAENGNSALLCGYMRNSGIVSNCWSAGKLLTSTENVLPFDNTQGHAEYFVGYLDKLNIDNCFVVEKDAYVDGATIGTQQSGVSSYAAEGLTNGEITYLLNKKVTDGTQAWYQKLSGEDADPYPVRTKLTDGTNIVFGYKDADGITRYGNTSSDEIAKVIIDASDYDYDSHRITDINNSGKVDVTDLTQFIEAATK